MLKIRTSKEFLLILVVFIAGSRDLLAQPTTLVPAPLVDGTGAFGKELVTILKTDKDPRQKENIHPFVIGYCGWRVRTLTSFSITRYDGMQLGLCKTILDFFDTEITQILTSIEKSAAAAAMPVNISPSDSKAIQDFVVMKYGMHYIGIADPKAKPDPVAKWKYGVGGNLGELAAYLTIWRRIWTNEKFESRIGSYLASLDNDIKSVPKGVDPSLVANLRKLNSLGSKTKFSTLERSQLNALLTQTLISAVSLVNVANLNPPVPAGRSSPVLDLALTSGPKTAAEYIEAGKAFITRGDFKNAIFEFEKAAKLEPANGLIFFHRALAHEKLGQVDDAIKDYNAVILLRVSLREAYFNRGTLFLNRKKFKSAIADLNAAIAIDPKYEPALFNRGLAHFDSKMLYAALADFNRVLKLKPTHVNALIMRSYIYCAQGLGMTAFKDQELATKLGGKFERGCK